MDYERLTLGELREWIRAHNDIEWERANKRS